MHDDPVSTTWQIHRRCTNCDVARQVAPGLIGEENGRSVILRQPTDEADLHAMNAAANACHVGAIQPVEGRLDPAADPYPMPLDDKIYLCGHNSPANVSANSFLLRRATGLMMIDTPLFSNALAARYEALGTITDVLLTHRDHAAHGQRYADRFGARLWIHEGDLDAAPGADQIMRGTDPIEIAEGVTAHPLYGHTEGSVIYVADDTYCFSGDSFYWCRTTGDIEVFKDVTWFSIRDQAASLQRTVPRLRFEWLLPGHGDRRRLPAPEMARRMRDMADRASLLVPRVVDFTAVRY
jgi:glyoxylase-like metal-dependent hydrolase (beta-lactamase superfamily II)